MAFIGVMTLALVPTARAQTISFVTPQNGSQTVGPAALEITTTIPNADRVDFFVDGALAGVARKPPYRIAHDFGAALTAHLVTAKVWSNGYRDVAAASVMTAALTSAESMTVDVVEVPMHIRSVQPPRPDDLRVTENGVAQTIREIHADRGPAHVVFVVDRSLSMGNGRLDAALRAISEESRLLRVDDRIDVVLFNHNVARPRRISRGERLQSVPTSGGTSLRDALSSIATPERTYAIVITDGGDRNSAIDEEDALRRISGTKMIVDAIVLGDTPAFLRTAAGNTGGTVATAEASSLRRTLHAMILDINNSYTLAYQSHGNGVGWRSIAITPVRRGIEIVNARKGYFAQ